MGEETKVSDMFPGVRRQERTFEEDIDVSEDSIPESIPETNIFFQRLG